MHSIQQANSTFYRHYANNMDYCSNDECKKYKYPACLPVFWYMITGSISTHSTIFMHITYHTDWYTLIIYCSNRYFIIGSPSPEHCSFSFPSDLFHSVNEPNIFKWYVSKEPTTDYSMKGHQSIWLQTTFVDIIHLRFGPECIKGHDMATTLPDDLNMFFL